MHNRLPKAIYPSIIGNYAIKSALKGQIWRFLILYWAIYLSDSLAFIFYRTAIIFCIICFAFLFLGFFLGTGINKGRETDKDRQRNMISKSCFTGVVSSVKNEEVVIILDSCISVILFFPMEYIPAFTFTQSNGRINLILNKKRLKISNVAKDEYTVKKIGADSITIGKRRFPLFD